MMGRRKRRFTVAPALLLAALMLSAGCSRPGGAPPAVAPPVVTPPAVMPPAVSPPTGTPPAVTPPTPTPPTAVAAPTDPALPSASIVAVYALADLLAGRKPPAQSWRVPEVINGFTLGPDGETALLFPQDPMIPGPAPYLLHLPTGKTTPLAGPARDGWYPFGGWLPDGRLMLAGKEVWLGDGAGKALRSVAKTGLIWVVQPSPRGGYLALWGPGGPLQILDLATGTVANVLSPFRRGVQDGAVSVAWSPDGKLLAGSDSDREDGRSVRIRIIDSSSREQVRTIEGLGLGAWLPDGNLIAFRPGLEGPIAQYLEITPEGKTLREYKGDSLSPVPGGRYLLEMIYKGADTSAFLIETATGERKPIPLPAFPRGWTPGGDPILITPTT